MQEKVPLSDLCLLITDGSHYSPKEEKNGIPMYSVKDMAENSFADSGAKHISEEEYLKLKRNGCEPEIDDVVIAKDGSVLKHVFRVSVKEKCVLLSSIAILRPNQKIVDSEFLAYSLKNPNVQSDVLANYISGSGVPRIVLKDFKRIPLAVPNLKTQKSIASVLRNIDRRAFLNVQLSKTLEQIAQTVFKSWFIDFDPVKAKMAGEKPVGMDDVTAGLFPDSVEDSEIGQIPSGWIVKSLQSIASQRKENVGFKDLLADDAYVGLDSIPRKSLFFSDWENVEGVQSGKARFHSKDILFGKLRPYFHKVVIAPIGGVCSTDVVVISVAETDLLPYVACLVNQTSFVDFLSNRSTGTRMPRTSWKEMCEYRFACPPDAVLKQFGQIMLSTFELGIALQMEVGTLRELRDSLLPRLISGELQIPEEMLVS
jgi:type I restriction enzyme S subunit